MTALAVVVAASLLQFAPHVASPARSGTLPFVRGANPSAAAQQRRAHSNPNAFVCEVLRCYVDDACLSHGRILPSNRKISQTAEIGDFDFRFPFACPVPVTESNGAPGEIIYLGACLIAAVRLAREEDWCNSPRVVSRISDSIDMAKRIYDRMRAEYFR
jgi:hypothetical protein